MHWYQLRIFWSQHSTWTRECGKNLWELAKKTEKWQNSQVLRMHMQIVCKWTRRTCTKYMNSQDIKTPWYSQTGYSHSIQQHRYSTMRVEIVKTQMSCVHCLYLHFCSTLIASHIQFSVHCTWFNLVRWFVSLVFTIVDKSSSPSNFFLSCSQSHFINTSYFKLRDLHLKDFFLYGNLHF